MADVASSWEATNLLHEFPNNSETVLCSSFLVRFTFNSFYFVVIQDVR